MIDLEATVDQDSRILIEYLRGLERRAVVHWSSHHVSVDEPWTTDWVDIRISDPGAPPFNWAWTIIGEDDQQGTPSGQLWQFMWPYDIDVHRVVGPGLRTREVSTSARGQPLPVPMAAEYEELARDIGGTYDVRGGWTVGTIGEALAHWTATHAARRDLAFAWDPEGEPDPVVKRVIERARASDDGAPGWDLGDGLVVADGLRDELLLMDPDQREALIGQLREAHRRLFGYSGSGLPPSPRSGLTDD